MQDNLNTAGTRMVVFSWIIIKQITAQTAVPSCLSGLWLYQNLNDARAVISSYPHTRQKGVVLQGKNMRSFHLWHIFSGRGLAMLVCVVLILSREKSPVVILTLRTDLPALRGGFQPCGIGSELSVSRKDWPNLELRVGELELAVPLWCASFHCVLICLRRGGLSLLP